MSTAVGINGTESDLIEHIKKVLEINFKNGI